MTFANTFWQRYRYVGLIICTITLSACASIKDPVQVYEGAKRPDSEIVKLLMPYELKVEQLDGKDLDTPYVPGGYYQIHLLPGEHQIMVFYEEYWGDATSGAIEISDIFNFKLTTTAGNRYIFKHTGPTDPVYADSGDSARDINIWVKQQDTGQNTQAVNRVAGGFFASITGQSAGDIKAGVVETTVKPPATTDITSTSPTVVEPVLAKDDTTSTVLAAEQIISQQDALERLKFWWKMADDKQRKAFQAWTWTDKANSE